MQTSEATKMRAEQVDWVGPRAAPELAPSAPTIAARSEPSARLANIERLRILAMLEIVTFHVGGALASTNYRLPILGGLGLPTFLLLNNAFNCTLAERMGTRAFLDVKVSRLLWPWLMWSGLYALLLVGQNLRHTEPLSDSFSPWMLLGGTFIHLWFVPFALFGSLVVAWAQRQTRAASHRVVACAMLGLGTGGVLAGGWLLHVDEVEWPLMQWLFALPSPLLGFALGRALLSRDRRLLGALGAVVTLVALGTIAAPLIWTVPEMHRRYAVSMALVCLLVLWPGASDALSRRLTPLLFGVYLVHPLLLRAYQAAHLPSLPLTVLGVVIFAAAALVVELLRRSPLARLV